MASAGVGSEAEGAEESRGEQRRQRRQRRQREAEEAEGSRGGRRGQRKMGEQRGRGKFFVTATCHLSPTTYYMLATYINWCWLSAALDAM
jgi:hypothetical protein